MFTVSCNPSLPVFRGNLQKTEQVVINLLVNSLEALENKGSSIKITTEFDDKQNEAVIVVEDDGMGMDDKILKF